MVNEEGLQKGVDSRTVLYLDVVAEHTARIQATGLTGIGRIRQDGNGMTMLA